MIPLDEARARILAQAKPLSPVSCPLALSVGRVLAEPVVATRQYPPTDVSAMDGVAVRFEDIAQATTERPVSLKLVGESRAGHPPETPVWRAEASRISTGATIPVGADTVVPLENVSFEGETVLILEPNEEGRHIRRQGESYKAGDELLPRGLRMNPAAVGLAASTGLGALRVIRRPRVAVLGTGDELVSLEQAKQNPEALIDSNGPMLAACLSAWGAEVLTVGRVEDDVGSVVNALEALSERADLILSTGGASVGTHDVIANAWEIAGVSTHFWKIAVKPGKPVRFGARNRQGPGGATPVLFLALPGNPLAVLTGFEQLVVPLLDILTGGDGLMPARLRVPMAEGCSKSAGRGHLVQGELRDGALSLAEQQGSHTLRAAATGGAVGWLPQGIKEIAPGQPVAAWVRPEDLRGSTLRLSDPLPPVMGVTGDSGTGKTWLIERLVSTLSERGLRVGTVKHASHEIRPDTPGKDSYRHAEAGAIRVALVGPGRRALFVRDDDPPTMAAWLEIFAGHVDLVLVEGFREMPMPRFHITTAETSAPMDEQLSPSGWPQWNLQWGRDEEGVPLCPDGQMDELVSRLLALAQTIPEGS
ncbi:MAG: gephyrin-like molybdotransferase Glp [Myxococcota bacterium]|nr:gephyrin-like molybdotransferase Glp [Myxococcota bacterium]